MGLENSQGDEKMELSTIVVRPGALPEVDNVLKGELSLEKNQDPTA